MNITTLVLVTEHKSVAGMAALAPSTAHAVVVGNQALAEAASAAGLAANWIEPTHDVPPEAYIDAVAEIAAEVEPRLLLASSDPAGRALLGAAAGRLGAALVPGVVDVQLVGSDLTVERTVANGMALETLVAPGTVACLFAGGDPAEAVVSEPGSLTRIDAEPSALAVSKRERVGTSTGVTNAQRVVAVGLGVRARDDLAMIENLTQALGAEIACSMPVADDRGWIEKARYIGRSGQHIAPQLYIAVGISGAPQHMEGVRDAKVVVAINNDPDAHVFRTADYGIVGDLYEVVPALTAAITK